LALDPASGAPVAQTKPLDIPKDVKWQEPTTVVKAASGAIPKGQGNKTVVSYVADGDTFSGKSGVNCRIDTIDAPEAAKPQYGKKGQPFGEESKRKLQEMILNKEVNIRIVKPADKYGRSICQVEIEGKGVDHEMVQAGAAWVYENFAKGTLREQALTGAQDSAKKSKRGLWADPNPTYPPDFRRGQ
jgi:endonuclease YncB( thermonuclease family)